jgi:O-antigen/teichoic acid export membrane protein
MSRINRFYLSKDKGKARFSDLLLVVVGQGAAAIGSFVTTKLLTNWLPPAEYGQLGLALTAFTLMQLCMCGPIAQATLRFYSTASEQHLIPEYLGATKRMLTFSGLCLAGLTLILIIAFKLRGVEAVPFLLVAIITSALYGIGLVLDGMQSGARKLGIVALHQTATQWLRPLCALGLFTVWGRFSIVAISGFLLATALVLVSQIYFVLQRFKQHTVAQVIRKSYCNESFASEMVKYARPFVSWGLIAWLQTASDRWFLEVFGQSQAVAIFTVCYQLGYYPMVLISLAISTYFTPILFQVAGDGNDPERIRRAARLNWACIGSLCVSMLAITVIHILFGRQVLKHLSTIEYVQFAPGLIWMNIGSALFSIGQALSMFFLIRGNSNRLVAIKFGTAAIGIALNWFGVMRYGVYGAVGACVLFGLVYCCWMVLLLIRHRVETRCFNCLRHSKFAFLETLISRTKFNESFGIGAFTNE